MTLWRRLLTREYRIAAILIVAAALLLRVVIPSGWMPATGADGLTRITICSGEGRVALWVDGKGEVHKGKSDSDPRHDQPCAFSGLAFAMADGLPPMLMAALTPTATDRDPTFPSAVAIGRGLCAPPPPATGPPVTV